MSIGSFVADKRIQSMNGDQFLAQSALALSSSLDCEQILNTISRICVPALADAALVNLASPSGESEGERKFSQDFAEGSPELKASQLPMGHDVLRACDPNAKVFVPLLAHGVPIGTLALFMTSADRKFGKNSMRIIEAFATLAANALDNARRFEQERRANRFKSEFLASMSHEVRTPMTAVLGFAELLAENETDPEKCEFLETIRSSGEHLLSVLNDILDLARLEAGHIEIACERVSVSRLLNDLQALMHFQAAKKRIRFSVEYEGSIPAEIETDPNWTAPTTDVFSLAICP